ncbi:MULTISPECIES: YegP family protein [unclassified Sphingobacterium]|uniref:YegP family protein n=1 Tax=unclassified Sphingobacterium TaxID=2609468 RepID=UPI0010487331|nr:MULTISPECIES: YegP family protein [unclassified Sphingobacterium]MCS3556129.1 uncharacterized protein YegP (UPF0339 family) [Sphingobacterium sp. JUb21]TCR08505.1 hypothetical protein EDF66_10352 [Sphingobacterium sp. JUb20]
MGKFVIKMASNGQFYFNLKANNGQIILSSEMYTRKGACMNGIYSVKKNSQKDNRFESKISSTGKPYFNLKASNGQVIGKSEMYKTTVGRNSGITTVITYAPYAPIVEDYIKKHS